MAADGYWTVLLLHLGLTLLSATYIPANVESSTHHLQPTSRHSVQKILFCPPLCSCTQETSTAVCSGLAGYISFQYLPFWDVQRLSLHGDLVDVPAYSGNLHNLVFLNLSGNSIGYLIGHPFKGIETLETVDLSFNMISYVGSDVFQMNSLKTLILRGNLLHRLPVSIFENLSVLEYLDLSENNFKYFHNQTFKVLRSLKVLNLSFNQIYFIYPGQFAFLPLVSLSLNDNQLTYIPPDVVQDILKIDSVSLANNPMECSCAMEDLVMAIWSHPGRFGADEALPCSRISMIYDDELPCTVQNVSVLSSTRSIIYQQRLELDCISDAVPEPSIVWLTPWGQSFAHSLNHHTDQMLHTEEKRAYKGVNLDLVTDVNVLRSGTLQIDHFRGYFAGTYTCIAISPVGTRNASIEIEMQHTIPSITIMSLLIGTGCSVVFLIIGLVVGLVKLCTRVIRKKMKKPVRIEIEKDKYTDYHDFTPTKTPLNSPQGETPIESPETCPTPAEDHMDRGITAHIFETLDEVRWRLRYGAEKKIERVRCHVQSLRESGSVYVQNIKESSSFAANRVRAGVVLGMEQMKYGVKSMKEFCGTGDMAQTVSIISVSTDVDTQQQTEVIKNVSYV